MLQNLRRYLLFLDPGALVMDRKKLPALFLEEFDAERMSTSLQRDGPVPLDRAVQAVIIHHELVTDQEAAPVVRGRIEHIHPCPRYVDQAFESQSVLLRPPG